MLNFKKLFGAQYRVTKRNDYEYIVEKKGLFGWKRVPYSGWHDTEASAQHYIDVNITNKQFI